MDTLRRQQKAMRQIRPYSVTFDDIKYTQIRADDFIFTEHFQSNQIGDDKVYTAVKMLEKHFPDFHRQKLVINLPEVVENLSFSLRSKIYRIAENHLFPVLPCMDTNLVNFFAHFENGSTDKNILPKEVDNALFATDGDIRRAVALIMQSGFTRNKSCVNKGCCEKPSIVKVTFDKKGITLHFGYEVDLQQRLEVACDAMATMRQRQMLYILDKDVMDEYATISVLSAGCRAFFSQNGHVLSLPYQLCSQAMNTLRYFSYALSKNPDMNFDTYAKGRQYLIEGCTDWYYPPNGVEVGSGIEVFLPYSEFKVSKMSIKYLEGREKRGRDLNLAHLMEVYTEHPEWDSTTDYTCNQVRQWLSTRTIMTARKHGFIENDKPNVYHFKFIDLLESGEEDFTF